MLDQLVVVECVDIEHEVVLVAMDKDRMCGLGLFTLLHDLLGLEKTASSATIMLQIHNRHDVL